MLIVLEGFRREMPASEFCPGRKKGILKNEGRSKD